jgi:hypothetical protein
VTAKENWLTVKLNTEKLTCKSVRFENRIALKSCSCSGNVNRKSFGPLGIELAAYRNVEFNRCYFKLQATERKAGEIKESRKPNGNEGSVYTLDKLAFYKLIIKVVN